MLFTIGIRVGYHNGLNRLDWVCFWFWRDDPVMSEQFWLSDEQVESFAPCLPCSRGKARVDDRRVPSGIIHVQRNGLRWCDAPAIYGPHKTLYNRHVRWTRNGVFARIFAALAEAAGPLERIIIDSTHLKAHRTAVSLLPKQGGRDRSGAPKAG